MGWGFGGGVGVLGVRVKPSLPHSAGGAGWWPARALGPVEPMPKHIKKGLKLSKNVVLGTNWVWVGRFDALDGGK